MFFFLFFLVPTRLSQNKQNLSSDSPVPWDCLQLRSLSSNAPSENFCVRYDGKMLATKFVEYLVTVRQGTRNPEKKARMTDTASSLSSRSADSVSHCKSSICRARSLSSDAKGRCPGKIHVILTNTWETGALQNTSNSPRAGQRELCLHSSPAPGSRKMDLSEPQILPLKIEVTPPAL